MKNSSPLLRESTSARLRTLILQRIIDGQYPPGHRLKELQLAREFNTSQAPVREALRELEATGIIESEPHRGSRVRTVSERELGEAYKVRAVLEQLAGELAAGKFSGGRETLLQRQADNFPISSTTLSPLYSGCRKFPSATCFGPGACRELCIPVLRELFYSSWTGNGRFHGPHFLVPNGPNPSTFCSNVMVATSAGFAFCRTAH